MYPSSDNEWIGYKCEPAEEPPAVGNVSRSWQWREMGIDPPNSAPNKRVLENIAEDILVRKPLDVRSCDLPGYPRSTFLMVFSPDGLVAPRGFIRAEANPVGNCVIDTKVASTHGNHNVYVSELASGKHVRILKGHPRTPWCIAFHPSHPQLIGSGCLGGQVRVWDIASGGSEVWNVRNETVVASIAFHPREQLLVIATYNELYFWDWSQPAPFTKVSTNNINEKVRYVAFDSLGYKLITGISLWACTVTNNSAPLIIQNLSGSSSSSNNGNSGDNNSGGRDDNNDDNPSQPPHSPGAAQDLIVNSYQTLVQRYDSLVRNYQRLFMVRHRLTNTPPTPNTIDRGTDPMETYPLDHSRRRRSGRRSSRASGYDSLSSSPSTSRRQESGDSGEGESSSRFLNFDVLSFIDTDQLRTPNQERTSFGSSMSAFQPLHEFRAFRSLDQINERTRLLPNPFSSTSSPRQNRSTEQQPSSNQLNSSRTSIFAPSRSESLLGREYVLRRRNFSAPQNSSPGETSSAARAEESSSAETVEPQPSTSRTSTQTPSTANSSTQIGPDGDAQSINESLDLIRDILRDSGTRLLNLITNMSMSILHANTRDRRGSRPLPTRLNLFSGDLRRDFLASSSDSDSDQPPPATPRRTDSNHSPDLARPGTSRDSQPPAAPTNRIVFQLHDEGEEGGESEGRASAARGHFRVRTQSTSAVEQRRSTPPPAAPRPRTPLAFDPDVPSTSTGRTGGDAFWSPTPTMSSQEAYDKVKIAVSTLQKHTFELANMWLRGDRASLRSLRTLWENLRRRVLALQRDTTRQENVSHYTRTLLERCMLLTEMTEIVSGPNSPLRGFQRPARDEDDSSTQSRSSAESPSRNSSGAEAVCGPPIVSRLVRERPRPARVPRSALGSRPPIILSPYLRRRVQPNIRWRVEDEFRRRARNPAFNRLLPRTGRSRSREFARAIEVSATRHEIRMRAMQVLSIMFNMMMMCLEERGLSQLIINMLKTLKKALAITCFMMVSKNPRANAGSRAPQQAMESMDVVRIQNVEHPGPVNVDGPDDPASPRVTVHADEPSTSTAPPPHQTNAERPPDLPKATISRATSMDQDTPVDDLPSPSPNSASQRWSHRLAVQISAANRNTSLTARTRRELYIESRRQKALHRTNPTAHPMIRKRIPPVSSHRIPVLRNIPSKSNPLKTPRNQPPNRSEEPVAGPSNVTPPVPNSPRESNTPGRPDNFVRLAQIQALRLRNAARNRFRRLQTIRLYTPSSVRDIFALHPQNNSEQNNRPENRPSPPANGEPSRRSSGAFAMDAQMSNEPEIHAILNNIPLMHINNVAPAAEPQGNQSPRLPRIHEYLQPIILAQNAMVVDEEGEGGGGGGAGGGGGGGRRLGGMAGLLDASIISEAMPAPAHRVQAWDFTTGAAPDISDNTKNVVVSRCRIHNDASIDISKDGKLLVALLPVPRLRNTNKCLGVYSLEWSRLGQCLHTAALEQSAVSVALSPSARYLAVGLGSRRFTSAPHNRNNIIALLYKLDAAENTNRSGLLPIKELEQHWEHGFTSLNCLRWAPQPGQGLVYANNTGQLIIMS